MVIPKMNGSVNTNSSMSYRTSPMNSSVSEPINVSEEWAKETYDMMYQVCYGAILPVILVFGIVGNTINIFVFTRSRFRCTLDDIEKSATTGLIALAISDLLFCLVALPETFLDTSSDEDAWLVYYKVYKPPLINLFLFISTWMVVAVAVERYLAVCHPIHARWRIRVWKTIIIDITIYVVSTIFNIPGFLRNRVAQLTYNGKHVYYAELTTMFLNHKMRVGYTIMYFLTGGVLPFMILSFCNTSLLLEVHRSMKRCANTQDRYGISRITLILVVIVTLFFLLVCPSQVLGFMDSRLSFTTSYGFRSAIVFTNILQVIYFSINFVLYTAMSKPFRDSLTTQRCTRSSTTSSNTNTTRTNSKYQLVGALVKSPQEGAALP